MRWVSEVVSFLSFLIRVLCTISTYVHCIDGVCTRNKETFIEEPYQECLFY